jgi:hypothetical protein
METGRSLSRWQQPVTQPCPQAVEPWPHLHSCFNCLRTYILIPGWHLPFRSYSVCTPVTPQNEVSMTTTVQPSEDLSVSVMYWSDTDRHIIAQETSEGMWRVQSVASNQPCTTGRCAGRWQSGVSNCCYKRLVPSSAARGGNLRRIQQLTARYSYRQ